MDGRRAEVWLGFPALPRKGLPVLLCPMVHRPSHAGLSGRDRRMIRAAFCFALGTILVIVGAGYAFLGIMAMASGQYPGPGPMALVIAGAAGLLCGFVAFSAMGADE